MTAFRRDNVIPCAAQATRRRLWYRRMGVTRTMRRSMLEESGIPARGLRDRFARSGDSREAPAAW